MSTQLDQAVDRMRDFFPHLPWTIRISHGGRSGSVGTGPERIELACRTDAILRDFARGDLASVLDRYILGELDLIGDIYAFVGVRDYVRDVRLWKVGMMRRLRYKRLAFIPSSLQRKRKAVSSHYDLPSDFILSYLDKKTRAYSCAMWTDPGNIDQPFDESLGDAQHRKFQKAAEALEVQPDDRFLDVGCGYGYMVRLVETNFSCRDATGITLSQNQITNGYSPNLQRRHYYELPAEGQYDKIYTCGMVSHLDCSEIERFYRHMYGLLRSGGKLWMHGIIPQASDDGRNNYNGVPSTFIQKYVFPDHYHFPIHVHLKFMEEAGFRVRTVHYRYGHYNKTLRHWYRRYVENLPQTRHLINPTIERAWHLFLTYGSVIDGNESIVKQVLGTKP